MATRQSAARSVPAEAVSFADSNPDRISSRSYAQWPAGVDPTREFEVALAHVARGGGHLFVTGKAGTGKSTLLRAIRDNLSDMVVLAPTGLAAVNVGGQTIHSFFSFPPRLIQPADVRPGRNTGIMRRIRALVIDEVSMVRADMMHGMDIALRLARKAPNVPFGGVQMVLFGDPHQLPPVVQQGEVGGYLEEHFGGPFFFNAPSLKDAGCSLLELTRIFRQLDDDLVYVLNRIRDGDADVETLDILNSCVRPLESMEDRADYITLTPTNAAAHRINMAYLARLGGAEYPFQAAVSGQFSDGAHPTDQNLVLKVGARVILIRNDPDRRWVNGTLARVAKLEAGRVWIEIKGEVHEVEPVTWENVRYAYDAGADKIAETVAGTFKQLPIRLAWALTIHKAQGLTLDKVYVDMGRGSFAHGQTYVALSRCRTLEGLALARPLRPADVMFDQAATGYRGMFHQL